MRFIKKIKNKFYRLLGRSCSPEVVEHLQCLFDELAVAIVHKLGVIKIRKYSRGNGLRVNFGSGERSKEGFLNLDYSSHADVRIDLRRKIPLPAESCSMVFSEHFLEHLSYPEGVSSFLDECYRILEPGGLIALSVPDTYWPLKEYIENKTDYLKACKEHSWHPKDCTTFMEHINFHFRQRWTAKSYSHFQNHRFAYDFETIKKKLQESGFIEIREREPDRDLDSGERIVGSLFAAAVKPD